MKNISIALFSVVALTIFGCSDKCQPEPLNVEELNNLFNLLSKDGDLLQLFNNKNYPVVPQLTESIKTSDQQIFELIQDSKYDLSLYDASDDCAGKFQILRANRNSDESPVGESIILIYNSSKAFWAQRDLIMEMDNFIVGMGAIEIFGSKRNANYLRERTGIEFYSGNFDVEQLLMLRRFEEGKDRIQIEIFYTESDFDSTKETFFITIRVYPKDERWSY